MSFVRATSGQALQRDQAMVELAKAAREILLEIAATYRGSITYRQLGIEVQKRAGVRVGRVPGWVVAVVTMVARVSHRLGEPPLTSLVVSHEDGRVGPAYDEALRLAETPAADADAREAAAAEGRLECYRRYAAAVPEDAEPALVTLAAAGRLARVKPAPAASTTSAKAAAKPAKKRIDPTINLAPHVVCSSCFIETPPADECQNCGATL